MPHPMMRAIRVYHYGGPEQLRLEDIPRPQPQAGEVLVRVYAAGVNPIDGKIRQGMFNQVMPRSFPYIPGSEFAGTIEQLGSAVTAFQPGQAVYGREGKGTYAEYTLVAADALVLAPRRLSFDQAASVPIGARTAWVVLFHLADLQAGQRILIHGAAGGVGSYAVQLARWKGAHIIGTASNANLDYVRALGADLVIDYQAAPFEHVVRDVDVVIDPIGDETQDRSWPLITPGGILIAIGHPAAEKQATRYGVRTRSTLGNHGVLRGDASDPLQAISQLLETGVLLPQPGPIFSLEAIGQAQALSDSGHGRGRIILHIADTEKG